MTAEADEEIQRLRAENDALAEEMRRKTVDAWERKQRVGDLEQEVERRREDIAWLLAAERGEPPLAVGEAAHEWTWDDYASRYITDYGDPESSEHKLRRVKCATCGQFWTHP